MDAVKPDIVLVHGAYFGAWCWDAVRPELERRGRRVVTLDLPVSDPAARLSDYADVVADAMEDDRPAVVVGHSMGGLVIPLVCGQRPVRRLVFLAGIVPEPRRSANEQRKAEAVDGPGGPTKEWKDLGRNVWSVGPHTAREFFYQDASPEQAASAFARLRPQSYGVFNEASPLAAWPAVAASYVVCRDDRTVNPAWGRTVALERLGGAAVEIYGGHSPFLTRPGELAGVLDGLAL